MKPAHIAIAPRCSSGKNRSAVCLAVLWLRLASGPCAQVLVELNLGLLHRPGFHLCSIMRLSRWSGSLPLGNDTRARERAAGLYNLFIIRLSRWSGRLLGADTRELERAAISEVMPLVMDRRTVQEPLRTPILPVRALAAAKNVEEEHHKNTFKA